MNSSVVVDFNRDENFHYNLGLRHVQNGRFLRALECFKRAININSMNPMFHFSLAGTLAELNNIEECINVLENATESLDVSPEFYFVLGCNYFNILEYGKAYKYFKYYLEISNNEQLMYESKEAIEFIDKNIMNKDRVYDREVERVLNDAKKEVEKGNYNEAIRILMYVIRKDVDNSIAYNNLAIVYYMINKIDLAIDLSRKVLNIEPNNSYAHVNLALFHRTIGNEDFYKMELKKLMKLSYNCKEDVINVVNVISKIGENAFLKTFLDDIVLKQDDAILMHFRALAHYNVGDFNEAEYIWKKLRERDQYLCIFVDCFLLENSKAKSSYPNFSQMEYDVRVFREYVVKIEGLIKSLIVADYKEFKLSWNNNVYIAEIVNYCLYKLPTKDRLKLLNNLATIEDDRSIDILNCYIMNCKINDQVRNECENILRLKRVVGDNIIKFK